MKSAATFIIILLLSLTGAAQTGILKIYVESNDLLPSTVVLSRNDTVVRTEQTNEGGYCEISFLPAGSYKVQVSQTGYITSELYDVRIEEHATTRLSVTLNHKKKAIMRDEEESYPGSYTGIVLSASLHPALDGTTISDDFASSYRYGMGNIFFSRNTNFLHLAWTQVISAGGYRLNNSARVKPYNIEAAEKYFYINYTLSFSVRANLIRGNNPGNPKMYLETGGAYAFPFYYRHITRDGRSAVHERNIHKFTETQAFARLGFNWISVRVKYNLTDYIKAGFPEPPRTEVALEMIIPAPN